MAQSMKTFITENFLLQGDTAPELYHEYAKNQPIIDYHCHLPPDQIAANRVFDNLHQIWLEGDHYKWRAMRTNGIDEKFLTGAASEREKFQAFAATVAKALRNPLYHWTHLELLRYFGIDDLLDENSAEEIWDKANAQLPNMPVHHLLTKSNVEVVCTTDDPADSLEFHEKIRDHGNLRTKVYPTYRPDKVFTVDQPAVFRAWVEKLTHASGVDATSFDGLVAALRKRHDDFHALGSRLSDHGMSALDALDCTDEEAAAIFDKALSAQVVSPTEAAMFRSYMMLYFGKLDAEKGWTKQLHIGVRRNNNTRLFRAIGPDAGFDSIDDRPQAASLVKFLDDLDKENQLPKTILYNLNPADNYLFGTMIGNFQDGTIAGKIQFGSGWWFLDQKEGMEWQINALSNLGLLSRFVGMLTDSRSFLSYTRHEYFRRILCNMIGKDVDRGELPRDMKLLGSMVADICYGNASRFFGFALPK